MPTWASIVSKSLPVAVPLQSQAEAKVVFHPFCADCGEEADVCWNCGKLAVYKLELCGMCFSKDTPSESMCIGFVEASNNAKNIPFKCSPCRAKRPWHWEDDKEVVSYRYVPMSFSFPVSPINVIRIPKYRTIGAVPTDPVQRADEARVAYEKELKFSGNDDQANRIYMSFYKNSPAAPPLKEGYVEMEDILKGQRVTPAQFFNAVRSAELENEEDSCVMPCDPATLSRALLFQAYREVCEDRKDLIRRVRKVHDGIWSDEDTQMMDAMDRWAAEISDEQQKRRSS